MDFSNFEQAAVLAKIRQEVPVLGAYENGTSTRRMILDAAFKLFFEKGYNETSYDDICREAHVNRGSIYYHFKEKENIRYEVIWELTIQHKRVIETFCKEEEYHLLLATYWYWHQFLSDERLRRFQRDYFADFPVYNQNAGLPQYYYTLFLGLYDKVWGRFEVEPVPFASVYGYIMGLFQIADVHPEQYSAIEMFRLCVVYGNTIFGVPKERIDELWENILPYMERIAQEYQ